MLPIIYALIKILFLQIIIKKGCNCEKYLLSIIYALNKSFEKILLNNRSFFQIIFKKGKNIRCLLYMH